jgi:hypothetical protein
MAAAAGQGPGGRDAKIQTDCGFGYLPATSVSEWADDAVARQPLNPPGRVLVLVLEAARQGADAAAAAVAVLAPRLNTWDQWAAYQAIGRLPSDLPEAARIVREIGGDSCATRLTARHRPEKTSWRPGVKTSKRVQDGRGACGRWRFCLG